MFSPDDYYAEEEHSMKPPHYAQHVTPTRVSIKEANEHLQLLHQRVSDLEDIIRSQGIVLSEKDASYRRQLKELKEAKDRHITELSRTVIRLEEKSRDFEKEVHAKNEKLEESQQKLILLDNFLSTSLPSFEKLISNLKQFSQKNVELLQVKQSFVEPVTISTTSALTAITGSEVCAEHTEPASLNKAIRLESHSDSGHPSSNNSDCSRANSHNLVLDELKGQFKKALQREKDAEDRERAQEPVHIPVAPAVHVPEAPPKPKHSKPHRSSKSLRKAPQIPTSSNSGSAPLPSSPLASLIRATSPTGSGSSTPSTSTGTGVGRSRQLPRDDSPSLASYHFSTSGQRSTPTSSPPTTRRPTTSSSGHSNGQGHVVRHQLPAHPTSHHHSQHYQAPHINKNSKGARHLSLVSNLLSEDDDVDAKEDVYTYEFADEFVPPPAPPAALNCANANLPAIKAPIRAVSSQRYYQSSY